MGIKQIHETVEEFIASCVEPNSNEQEICTEIVIDRERGHYEIMELGWDGDIRIHHSVIHIDIIDNKVWIQHNATEMRVAEELVNRGIPRKSIVIGFHPPRVRQLTEFAVA